MNVSELQQIGQSLTGIRQELKSQAALLAERAAWCKAQAAALSRALGGSGECAQAVSSLMAAGTVLEQAAATNTPFMQVIRLALDHPLLYALISLASMVFQIYFAAALLFLGFRLSGARQASFYIIFQVVAYSSAPMLLCIIPLIGSQVGFIWAIACLVNGCRVALQLDWPRTLLGFAPLVLLCALFALGMPLP